MPAAITYNSTKKTSKQEVAWFSGMPGGGNGTTDKKERQG